ncbi:MAG TPA: VOC family protein [Vicinamibacterales bacterium]|nr:VOC family protein [Vicinamibacterales bacterium]
MSARAVLRSAALVLVAAVCGAPVFGQAQNARSSLAAPNAAGVSMGHLHYRVRDVAANRRFWVALGGQPVAASKRFAAPGREILRFQDVLVVLDPGETTGGTEGSVVNHVAFRVPTLAPAEAAGLTPARLAQFPGVSSVMSPENERIELFENAATNLTFAADGGARDAAAERHNRPLAVPIAFHHVHLYLPGAAAVPEAKAWYAKVFGGVPGKRAQYDATDVPGINLNFSAAPRPTLPTKGRMLDHIGFEVVRLRDFCRRLEGMGVVFDELYSEGRDGIGRAQLTDPWGTTIELTEGLDGL